MNNSGHSLGGQVQHILVPDLTDERFDPGRRWRIRTHHDPNRQPFSLKRPYQMTSDEPGRPGHQDRAPVGKLNRRNNRSRFGHHG